MAGRWKPPKGQRIDAEAMRRKKELPEKLADILDDKTHCSDVPKVIRYLVTCDARLRPGWCCTLIP